MDTREESSTPDPVAETVDRIGSKIAGARAAKRLTQLDVARRASVSPVRVSSIETGREMPRLDTLAKIAGAVGLRVTLEEIAA